MKASQERGLSESTRATATAQTPICTGSDESAAVCTHGAEPVERHLSLSPTIGTPPVPPGKLAKLSPDVQTYLAGWLPVDDLLALMWVSRGLAKVADRDARLAPYHALVEQSTESIQMLRSIHTRLRNLPDLPIDEAPRGPDTPAVANRTRASQRERLCHDKNVVLSALLFFDKRFEHTVMQSARVQLRHASMPAPPGANPTSQLHEAIGSGSADEVGRFMDEFLAIPANWLATPRKVDWLRQAKGERSTLAFFAQYRNTLATPTERGQCQAARAYVRAISGSPYLDLSDKRDLLATVQLEMRHGRAKPVISEVHLVQVAMMNQNPGLAAAVLLGITESRAEPDVKAALLQSVVRPWPGGITECTEVVGDGLEKLKPNAPEWIQGWQEDLHAARSVHAPSRNR